MEWFHLAQDKIQRNYPKQHTSCIQNCLISEPATAWLNQNQIPLLFRKRTISTERPPLVGEISDNLQTAWTA
jgi:hypothetical protein